MKPERDAAQVSLPLDCWDHTVRSSAVVTRQRQNRGSLAGGRKIMGKIIGGASRERGEERP